MLNCSFSSFLGLCSNCTPISLIQVHNNTVHVVHLCMCPQLHPQHPPWKVAVGFVWVGCLVYAVYLTWALGLVQHLLLELMTHCGLMEIKFMLRLASKHGCCCESSCHPPLLVLRRIIHIFTNSQTLCSSRVGSQSFPLSLHPSKSLTTSLPFGADVLLFLYPPTCFTHTHLLSVSHWATFWSRERTTDEKESLFF